MLRSGILNAALALTLALTASLSPADDLDAPPPASSDKATTIDPRAELGRQLFFDPLLSSDRTVSCASCHKPEHAFADNIAFSKGVGKALGKRNTPSVMNSTARVSFFWDGRAATLEQQAIIPIENPIEMNLPIAEALERVNAEPKYAEQFARLYGGAATARTLGRALAAFQKTLETANSPYDRYNQGDDTAISAAAKRGRLLFIGKANCATCHSGEDFTSDRFENIGLFNGNELNDRGRADITRIETDAGMFKVPTLRNVAMNAPYMHNGMFKTLREVIDYYNEPDKLIKGSQHRDAKLDKPLALSETDIGDIEAFLTALTDDRFRTSVAASGVAGEH